MTRKESGVGVRKESAPAFHRLGPADLFSRFLPAELFAGAVLHGNLMWTPPLLVWAAVLSAWSAAGTLLDRFTGVRAGLSRLSGGAPIGSTYAGFAAALRRAGGDLLDIVRGHLRRRWSAAAFERSVDRPVFAVDGTRIETARTAANQRAFGWGGKPGGPPQMMLVVVRDVDSGAPWDFRIADGSAAERTLLRQMLDGLPAGARIVADAGLLGYDLLAEILAGGRSFLLRVGKNVSLLRRLGFAARERSDTVYLWPGTARGRPPLVLRQIRLRLGRRRACLLTDAGPSQLSDAAAARLYRRRWGIEVFYRSLKQTMVRRTMRSGDPDNARAELAWSVVGLWVLTLAAAERFAARRRDPLRLSPAGALRRLRAALDAPQALDLTVLDDAVLDDYRRRRPKTARRWPRKRTRRPPGLPRVRRATPWEIRLAGSFKPAA